MYVAFENVANMVASGGQLFISIYNDQGGASNRWKWIKEKYNNGSCLLKAILIYCALSRLWISTFIKDFLKSGNPFKTWITYGKNNRGMSAYHDVIDWVGGYPFEVAKPEEVFIFFKERNFELQLLKTCAGGLGCNEYVFKLKH
jgi:2-polyprenyl-6-hydroxyphenyl methylase/3-demethylubiquinone-9 3-methyltransferase